MVTLATVPVPFSTSVCGLPGALSATFIVAVRAPVALGVKVTFITHVPLVAASTEFAVQVVVPGTMAKSAAFAPVIVTGVAAREEGAVPVLDTVIVTAELVVPCA
jgi:hypothetical protein